MGALVVLAVLIPSGSGLQDSESSGDGVLDRIDAESAAVLVLRDPAAILDWLGTTGLYGQDDWHSALKLLPDLKLPAFSGEEEGFVATSVSELGDLLRDVRELSVIVHSMDDDRWEFTIVVEAGEQVLDQLEQRGVAIQEAFSGGNEDSRPVAGEQADNAASPEEKLTVSRQGLWLLVSNSPSGLAMLLDGPDAGRSSQESISSSRKFRSVMSRIEGVGNGTPMVEAFGNPAKLRAVFAETSDDDWESWKMNELSAFGARVWLFDGSGSDRFANLVVEGRITLTQPRTGIGQLIESYRPVEDVPPLVDKPHFLRAHAWDPMAMHAAKKAIWETANPGKDYLERVQAGHAAHGRKGDYMQESVPRTDMTISVSYPMPPEIETIQKHLALIMEPVADDQAMRNWFHNHVTLTDSFRRHGNNIRPCDCEHGELLAANGGTPDEGWSLPIDIGTPVGDGRQDVLTLRRVEQSYFLNDDWYMTGAIMAIRDQLELMYAGGDRDQPAGGDSDWREMLAQLESQVSLIDKPCWLEYRSNSLWRNFASRFFLEKVEGENRMNEYESQLEQLTNDQREFPVAHIVPVNVEDARLILQARLLMACASTFGEQLTVISQRPDQVQFVLGCFPAPGVDPKVATEK